MKPPSEQLRDQFCVALELLQHHAALAVVERVFPLNIQAHSTAEICWTQTALRLCHGQLNRHLCE